MHYFSFFNALIRPTYDAIKFFIIIIIIDFDSLQVLGTRRLMHIPYDEFERVMVACFEVFSSWDDEYDKLQGLLRDIVKKKREEHMKMVWRVNPAHKRLQGRLENMRK